MIGKANNTKHINLSKVNWMIIKKQMLYVNCLKLNLAEVNYNVNYFF
jgi:uncharacterized protein YunC (DUF1805 family)